MVKKLASKIGETSEGWLLRHGMTWEDAKAEAYPAVHDAAKSYDPKRGAFGTHAYYFIRKRLRRSVSPQDALNRTSYYEPPDRAEPAQEPNDEPDLIVWLFRPPPGEHVKRRLRDLDAEDLNRADRLLPLPGPPAQRS